MTYIPLRVYSVYSKGEGVVSAKALAEALQRQGVGHLAVCDPLSLLAWEAAQVEAEKAGLRPLLGLEIPLREKGDLLVFPRSRRGYLSLVACLNQRRLQPMAETAAVFVPRRDDRRLLERLRLKTGSEPFFLGLEWRSPKWLVERAQELGLPLAWAQPLRWLAPEGERTYAVARAVFGHRPLQETLNADAALDGWLSAQAIRRRWGKAGEEAMANTLRLAESAAGFCFAPDAPAGAAADRGGMLLEKVIARRLREIKAGTAERERAARELRVIHELGFSAYFLLAAEVADFCRQQRIYFNLRGSGVSSYVLYLLEVSRIDPLVQGLIFERFVNRLRNDLPDIDIDIDSSRRSEVFAWLFERYRSRVAFVSTHKFFGGRSALHETARAAGFGPEEAQALGRDLPMFAEPRELAGRGRGEQAWIYESASRLDGVYKELSLHVGGVVFADGDVNAVFPMERSPDGYPQIAWNKDGVERLRIFKLDLLGVRGFDVISPLALGDVALEGDCAKVLEGDSVDVWETIRGARTVGCFQLESPLARESLRRGRPANLEELAISVAIIRPGPAKSGMKKAYLEGQAPPHPLLAKLFPGTRGALIFEEQIAVLLHQVSGWSLEKAEVVRKGLKKKVGEAFRQEFFELAGRRGWTAAELELFWKLAGDFSLYAFCQAHSAAYAYSAFLSAWLKTRQPLTFFCRLFNAAGGYYPLAVYIEEAKRCGVAVLPPDVNRSGLAFAEAAGAVRSGLLAVKGVGEKLAGRIVEKRGSGYGGLEEFLLRSRANERELSALLAVSALQSLGFDGLPESEKKKNWKEYLGFLPGPATA